MAKAGSINPNSDFQIGQATKPTSLPYTTVLPFKRVLPDAAAGSRQEPADQSLDSQATAKSEPSKPKDSRTVEISWEIHPFPEIFSDAAIQSAAESFRNLIEEGFQSLNHITVGGKPLEQRLGFRLALFVPRLYLSWINTFVPHELGHTQAERNLGCDVSGKFAGWVGPVPGWKHDDTPASCAFKYPGNELPYSHIGTVVDGLNNQKALAGEMFLEGSKADSLSVSLALNYLMNQVAGIAYLIAEAVAMPGLELTDPRYFMKLMKYRGIPISAGQWGVWEAIAFLGSVRTWESIIGVVKYLATATSETKPVSWELGDAKVFPPHFDLKAHDQGLALGITTPVLLPSGALLAAGVQANVVGDTIFRTSVNLEDFKPFSNLDWFRLNASIGFSIWDGERSRAPGAKGFTREQASKMIDTETGEPWNSNTAVVLVEDIKKRSIFKPGARTGLDLGLALFFGDPDVFQFGFSIHFNKGSFEQKIENDPQRVRVSLTAKIPIENALKELKKVF